MGAELTPAEAMRLASWLSPAFPIGAFSYSHGLERAVEAGAVSDEAGLLRWIGGLLDHGSVRSDGLFFAAGHDAASERERLVAVAELGAALRASAELFLETSAQGSAFLAAVRAGWPHRGLAALERWLAEAELAPVLPVIAGAACALHRLPRRGALALFLHSAVASLVSTGVRLVPLGQTAGLRVVAALEPALLACAAEASAAGLDDLGSACALAEIYSMQHEVQYTRLFRS